MKATYFFAGDWRKGFTQFYERPLTDNTGLYTIWPADARHLGWSETEADRAFALDQIQAANINTVTMSSWGKRGDDRWAFWAPMHTSTYAHDQLFDEVVNRNVFIVPAIESGRCTQGLWQGDPSWAGAWVGQSWSFNFASEFPWFTGTPGGSPTNPSPALVAQLEDLVQRYILHPANPAWPTRWAQVFDRTGMPRYAVNLIHVASNQIGAGSDQAFAAAFDYVANKVHSDLGVWIGFTLDLLPTPIQVDQNCGSANDPSAWWTDTFTPTAQNTGPFLANTGAVLAVQAYIPEVWSATRLSEANLMNWKTSFIAGWAASGVPVILDVDPGYEAHGANGAPDWGWGWDDAWFNFQSLLKSSQVRGIVFNTWNGFTEGYAGMPLLRSSGTDARASSWLQALFSADPRSCDYWHMSNGALTYHVYGAICDKWKAGGALRVTGAPTSSEQASPGGNARVNYFADAAGNRSAIYWDSSHGANIVYGGIYATYVWAGQDANSSLGRPTSDEGPTTACSGGRIQSFEFGHILWCNGDGIITR